MSEVSEMSSTRLQQDFDEIPLSLAEPFRDADVLVTGATGFLGSLIVRYFAHLNARHDFGVRVVGAVRDADRARSLLGDAAPDLIVGDISDVAFLAAGRNLDFIFHTAAITVSKDMVDSAVEVVTETVAGVTSCLELAQQSGARLVYLSSMEAYGVTQPSDALAEHELGYVDLRQPRSSYPVAKRVAEFLCRAHHLEYGTDAVVARLAHCAGVGTLAVDNRIFMQFARRAIDGEPIVIRSTGESEIDFVYASDALAALLVLGGRADAGETYNIANPANHSSVRSLASAAMNSMGRDESLIQVDFDPANANGYAPDTKLRLSAQKLLGLGWRPVVDLASAFRRVAADRSSSE